MICVRNKVLQSQSNGIWALAVEINRVIITIISIIIVLLCSGVEFATDENRPAKFDLREFEVCTEDEASLWNEQIDALIACTKLFCPPNR